MKPLRVWWLSLGKSLEKLMRSQLIHPIIACTTEAAMAYMAANGATSSELPEMLGLSATHCLPLSAKTEPQKSTA